MAKMRVLIVNAVNDQQCLKYHYTIKGINFITIFNLQ